MTMLQTKTDAFILGFVLGVFFLLACIIIGG